MQDVLLLAAVAVMFAFGWVMMKKLDCFLESNRHMQELQRSSGGNALRLGFCNPMAADSITNVLEQYSKLYPDMEVRIFCGSEEKLLKGLSSANLTSFFCRKMLKFPLMCIIIPRWFL